MKKKLILGFMIMAMFPILLGGLLFLMLFGGGEASTEPVALFATEEKAEQYQYVGSELGIPWEITLLADGIFAQEKGLDSIEEINPLLTALEFCILQEEKSVWDEEEETWQKTEEQVYTGCDEILGYIGMERNDFAYTECSVLVAALQAEADRKTDAQERYRITLVSNLDYREVLLRIGLSEEYAGAVIELHDAHYLAYKYGYMTELDDDLMADAEESFEQIPVTQGSVTREELARVAVSILNWPYLLGGKSYGEGVPSGPLDCSGYVDWVYLQCFGKGVSAGKVQLPSGAAVSGTAIQYYACDAIEESELKVGDLGFLKKPENVAAGAYNHVGIYLGELGGRHVWVHCGGSSFGYAARPKGRVGISLPRGENNYNPVTGGTFSPPMKGCNFQYFRRPRFEFKDDVQEETA